MRVIPLCRIGAISCAGWMLAACGWGDSFAEGDAETDRQSETVAVAISYPRQSDAAGFARAALATPLGRSSNFSVLEATDLDQESPGDPIARLVWRIHRDESGSGWHHSPAFDACYRVEFNEYGVVTEPSRIDCPENATAYTPPPVPKRNIPLEFGHALEVALDALPATPSEEDVRAGVTDALLPMPVDKETGLAGVPPQILVAVSDADVGVALLARTGVDSKACLMGQRVDGAVEVWSLNWRELGPLERPCTAEAALTR